MQPRKYNLRVVPSPLFIAYESAVDSRTTDTRWLNPKFFAVQIQIPIPNKYLGFGYKGLVFCRNNGKLGQGSQSTKMGADK